MKSAELVPQVVGIRKTPLNWGGGRQPILNIFGCALGAEDMCFIPQPEVWEGASPVPTATYCETN